MGRERSGAGTYRCAEDRLGGGSLEGERPAHHRFVTTTYIDRPAGEQLPMTPGWSTRASGTLLPRAGKVNPHLHILKRDALRRFRFGPRMRLRTVVSVNRGRCGTSANGNRGLRRNGSAAPGRTGRIAVGWDRSVSLIAVCDRNLENANDLADEAGSCWDPVPTVFGSVADMVAGSDGLEAADCTTDTGSHHIVATELVAAGIHTLVEKPIALSIRGAQRVMDAAAKTGAILSVAENYRRDPMNRLVKALLDGGVIGEPHLILETTIGGRDTTLSPPGGTRN